jgi:hypothetical protein
MLVSRETAVDRPLHGVRLVLLAVAVASVAVAISPASHPQNVLAAPAASVSRYEQTLDSNKLWTQGCNAGGTNGATIIAWGEPWYQNGTYGTWNWSNQFFSIAQITNAAESWLWGFGNCRNNGTVKLAVGTSNDFGYTGSAHGSAWAAMINSINAWIDIPPTWIGFEQARGAIDSELGWATAAVTKPWATGYDNTYSCVHACAYYYNFGDANSCPPYGNCHAGWTQYDVWWMSWGAIAAYPFPEIYWYAPGSSCGSTPVNAQQWQAINVKYPLWPEGILTQKAASGSSCTNSAAQGWQEWANASGLSATYSSDITWAN